MVISVPLYLTLKGLQCLNHAGSPPGSHPNLPAQRLLPTSLTASAPSNCFCCFKLLLLKPESQPHMSTTFPKSRAVLPAKHTAKQNITFHVKHNKSAPTHWKGCADWAWNFFTPSSSCRRRLRWFATAPQVGYERERRTPAFNDLSRAVAASWQEPLLKHQRASLSLLAQHCCQWLSSFYKSSCSRVQKPNNNLEI